jgi:hypothetical protein
MDTALEHLRELALAIPPRPLTIRGGSDAIRIPWRRKRGLAPGLPGPPACPPDIAARCLSPFSPGRAPRGPRGRPVSRLGSLRDRDGNGPGHPAVVSSGWMSETRPAFHLTAGGNPALAGVRSVKGHLNPDGPRHRTRRQRFTSNRNCYEWSRDQAFQVVGWAPHPILPRQPRRWAIPTLPDCQILGNIEKVGSAHPTSV